MEKNGLESHKAEMDKVSVPMNPIAHPVKKFAVAQERDWNFGLPNGRNSGLRFPEFLSWCCFSLLRYFLILCEKENVT